VTIATATKTGKEGEGCRYQNRRLRTLEIRFLVDRYGKVVRKAATQAVGPNRYESSAK
jgi:hypothetical protein